MKPEKTQRHRQRRSLARSEAQIARARELRRNETDGMVLEAPELFVEKVLDVAWSLRNVFSGEL